MKNGTNTIIDPLGNMPMIVRILLLSFAPFWGFVFLVLYFYLCIVDSPSVAFILLNSSMQLPFSLFLLAYGWVIIASTCARYQFTELGLYAKYPLQEQRIIPWKSFQQICICYDGYTTRGPSKACTAICFVQKGEKKNMYGRWKTNTFNYRGVISIALNPDLLLELQLTCDAPITDLRGTRCYRHPTNARPDIKLKTPEEIKKIREELQKEAP